MTGLRALIGAAILALASTMAAAPMGSVALADPIGSCTRTHGTIVAVDYGHWSGPIVRGCGVDSANGFQLLLDAGFTTTGDSHDGPAFACRIGNSAFHGGTQYPTPSEDACVVTPPASAYWSYWLAPPGQHTWSYSQLGAVSDHPKPGEVQLWMFGGTNLQGTSGSGVPSFSPDTLRPGGAVGSPSTPHPPAHSTPHRATTSHAGTAHQPGAPAARAPSAGANHTAARSSGRPANAVGSGSATGHAALGGAAAASSGAGASGPRIVNAGNTTEHPSGGSAVPVVVGLLLAVVLAAGAGYATMRRRRAE